jgi:hypothetical protein
MDELEYIGIVDLTCTRLFSAWIIADLDVGNFGPCFFHGGNQVALVALHVVGIVQQLASGASHRSTDHVGLVGMTQE